MKVYTPVFLCSVIMAETILLNSNYTNDYIYNSFDGDLNYCRMQNITLIFFNNFYIFFFYKFDYFQITFINFALLVTS